MPSVMTYIRQSDEAKYLAILEEGRGAWTEFIHQALANVKPKKEESDD